MRAYALQAKNKELEIDAAEIRVRAERRLGELLKAQKETVGLAPGGQPYQRSTGTKTEPVDKPTLNEAGIDKKLSSRAQKLAAVPEDQFESMLGDWRERVHQETERVTVNLLREGEKSRNAPCVSVPDIPRGTYSSLGQGSLSWRGDLEKLRLQDG